MNRTTRRGLAALVLSFAALVVAGPAAATGLRTSADCASLTEADRTACHHCVKRVKKHVYDTDQKPGRRCVEEEAHAKK